MLFTVGWQGHFVGKMILPGHGDKVFPAKWVSDCSLVGLNLMVVPAVGIPFHDNK